MRSIHVKNILLEDGWQRDVRLQITNGIIQAIDFDVISDNDYEVDIAIPGLCNAHSHSFQRALKLVTGEEARPSMKSPWATPVSKNMVSRT